MSSNLYIFVFLLLPINYINAQSNSDLFNDQQNLQYGFSIKCQGEISFRKDTQKPILSCALNGGVGSNFLIEEIHPAFNLELLFYSGGLGSPKGQTIREPRISFDLIAAFTFTAGHRNSFRTKEISTLADRNIPLYYFGNFSYPSLINPFKYSASLGTNLIFSTDKRKSSQRIGFLNIHADKFQISYFNDGGAIFSQTRLGDKYDRYYTAGLVLSYNGDPDKDISLVEISYYKFTGYSKNAFEISNKLDLAYVGYRDSTQMYYNKSLWTIHIGNPVKGYGGNLKFYNHVAIDLQHSIHSGLDDAYHISPYSGFIAISGQYNYTLTKIGVR